MKAAFLLTLTAALAVAQPAIAIRGGTVIPVSSPVIANGVVVMRGGKIAAVGGPATAIPAGAEIVEAAGKFVLPGLVDAMTSLGMAASDLNETTDSFTPQVKAISAFNPFGAMGAGKAGPIRMKEILVGGVTAMYIAPADGAVIGGQGAVVKTAGDSVDAMTLREPAAIDITLGEPPKKAAAGARRDPSTRMAEVALLRQMLVKAQEYDRNRKQNPALPRDLALEALGKLLNREIPARLQANSPTDIRNALSLSQEFGFDLILDGGAASQKLKVELAARKIPVVLGQVSHPFISNDEIPDRSDYPPTDETTAAKLTAAGVKIALATFSRAFGTLAPAGTSKWLLLDASVSAGYGMQDDGILRAVTLSPAEILGVADRIGSLAPGKDADVIILDGPPLSIRTWVERVYISGILVHQR
jgi:imidazolonepropionase-like amidohydrolase